MSIGFSIAFEDVLSAGCSGADVVCKLEGGRRLMIFGELFYHRSGSRVRGLGPACGAYLKRLFDSQDVADILPQLEGQYLAVLTDPRRKEVRLFSDLHSRQDHFYARDGAGCHVGDSLDFIFRHVRPEYDQKMLAHLFCVYGWYTPKGTTIYSNVHRLKAGEILTLSATGMRSEALPFKPLPVQDYGPDKLGEYHRILRDSVAYRANRGGMKWVSSSSGWDSSMILGLLVDLFGARNVGMVTGSMQYSGKTAVINRFEIDKIKKIGAFYGIKPHVVDLDFKSRRAPDYWKRILPYFKARHNYTFATFNFTRISDKLAQVAGRDQTIFNGETSDSFHNFGFSQFATFFHTQKSFTEYADKMNCYLYSPSFFKKVLQGTHQKDRVYRIFKAMSPGVEFAEAFPDRESLVSAYLYPLFYGGPRIPFARTQDNPVLTRKGQREMAAYPFREYCPQALTARPETLYSWIIQLYHSFHSQGSTVNIQKYAMQYNGHHWRSPFNDLRMIELLSQAPESWGRGLDLNHTKHPLKWVARNKIKFPYELLETGPHSYLYDVVEGFSLFAEITYRSGVTPFFKETLADKPYRKLLTGEYCDLRYLDRIVDDYLAGKEVRGHEFNNLVSLITLCITGWY